MALNILRAAVPFAALALAVSTAHAGSFTLTDDTTRACICIPPRPTPAESLAASEIARYVELMSGVRLDIKSASSPPEGAVVVSAAGRLDSMPLDAGEEGYRLTIRDGRLYLTGARDRSVIYAAYDLLERLGCRWLAPGFDCYEDASEFVPSKLRVTIDLDEPVVRKPRFKLRKLYVEEGHSHNAANLLQMVEWMSKSRFNVLVVPTDYQGQGRVRWDDWREALTPEVGRRDIQIEVGGHGYQNFINAEMEDGKLFDVHPEWFGADAKGRRERSHNRVFCTSNPAAVDYLTENVLAYLSSHPEIEIFDFWPPDGARWCECAECEKLGPPQDRQSRLVSHVLAEARKRGIRTRFECIAYSMYTAPPTQPPMDESVLIDFCPINQCFESQICDPSSEKNADYAGSIGQWVESFGGDVSIYSYYRKYAWRCLPVIIPHYMQSDLRWYARTGLAGISSYAEPGDWRTYELNHYVLSRLAWDPEADVDALIADFCIARYGDAAGGAKRAYQVLEETVRRASSIPFTSLKQPEEIERHAQRLRAARTALAPAAGDSAVDALLAAVDYALRDFALQKQISEGATAAELEALVDELVQFLGRHDGQGLFLQGGRLSKESLLSRAYRLRTR